MPPPETVRPPSGVAARAGSWANPEIVTLPAVVSIDAWPAETYVAVGATVVPLALVPASVPPLK